VDQVDQHLEDLSKVFEIIKSNGLKINIEKYNFHMNKVKVLDHRLTTDDIRLVVEKNSIKRKSSTLEPRTLIRKTKTNTTDKSAVKTTEPSIVHNSQTSPDGELFNRKIIKSHSHKRSTSHNNTKIFDKNINNDSDYVNDSNCNNSKNIINNKIKKNIENTNNNKFNDININNNSVNNDNNYNNSNNENINNNINNFNNLDNSIDNFNNNNFLNKNLNNTSNNNNNDFLNNSINKFPNNLNYYNINNSNVSNNSSDSKNSKSGIKDKKVRFNVKDPHLG